MSNELMVSMKALLDAKTFGAHINTAEQLFKKALYGDVDPSYDLHYVKAELRQAIKSIEQIECYWKYRDKK
jgi:hypothetical protein